MLKNSRKQKTFLETRTTPSQQISRWISTCISHLSTWNNSTWYYNRTPGYHRKILRPPILLKMPFGRMKAFFNTVSSYFLNFPNLNRFLAKKNREKKVERNLQEKIQFETHCRTNLPNLAIFKKFTVFFRKNSPIIPKKGTWNALRMPTTAVAFYSKFATSW